MPAPLLFLVMLALARVAFAANAAGPDDPRAAIRPDPYRPVISGSKSYRPVEPLPWGDVNRRVAPTGKSGTQNAPRPGGAPGSPQEHKH